MTAAEWLRAAMDLIGPERGNSPRGVGRFWGFSCTVVPFPGVAVNCEVNKIRAALYLATRLQHISIAIDLPRVAQLFTCQSRAQLTFGSF
jgi:hypothetical protein